MVADGKITKTIKQTVIDLIEDKTKLLGFYFKEGQHCYYLYPVGALVASRNLVSTDAIHNSTELDGILIFLSGYEQCVKDNDVKLNQDNTNSTVIHSDEGFEPDVEEDTKLERTWENDVINLDEAIKDVEDIDSELSNSMISKEDREKNNTMNAKRAKEVDSMRAKSVKITATKKDNK